jgi:N6-adenosine-specific RNA methylase IME4
MKQMCALTPKEGERMIPRDLWIRQFPVLKREKPDPPSPASKVERKHVSKKKRAGWVSGGRIVGEGARQHKYWLTPPKLKQALDAEFGFDFDPCPFPLPDGWDALAMPWGKTNYVNAPFSREDGPGLTAFVRKAIEEQKQGKTSVLILPMPEMFNRLIEACAEVRSVGRVRFLDTVTREPHPAPFACSIFVLRGHTSKKREEPVVEREKTKVGWPVGQYDVILTDPPWYYGDTNPTASAGRHYNLMSDEELMDMPVPSLLAPRGILFMWTTSSMLARSIDLMRHYGLEFRGVAFAWIKTKKDGTPVGAQGYRPSIVKPIIELVIAGSRVMIGRPLPLASESICQTIYAPRGRHSEKPPDVHERLEVMYPDARRLEMFARSRRPQWTAWGNELPERAPLLTKDLTKVC